MKDVWRTKHNTVLYVQGALAHFLRCAGSEAHNGSSTQSTTHPSQLELWCYLDNHKWELVQEMHRHLAYRSVADNCRYNKNERLIRSCGCMWVRELETLYEGQVELLKGRLRWRCVRTCFNACGSDSLHHLLHFTLLTLVVVQEFVCIWKRRNWAQIKLRVSSAEYHEVNRNMCIYKIWMHESER